MSPTALLPAKRAEPPAARVHYIPPDRPWLSLYGLYLKPKQVREQVELAPIQALLPDEIMLMVLSNLSGYTLGSVACVCSHWRGLAEHPRLWESVSREALHLTHADRPALHKILTQYKGCWRRVFIEHPHLRFDGIYVSRNTYVKPGVAEFSFSRKVHLVSYFRYYRFFPDGTMLYRTTPLTISKVAKSLRSSKNINNEEHVFCGRYMLRGTRLYLVITYPNSRSTEIRTKMQLRSTITGANNRLDIESIVSYDRELGTSANLQPVPQDEEEQQGQAPQGRLHRRGLNCCVFVPWQHTQTSVLNLPPSEMDIFLPG